MTHNYNDYIVARALLIACSSMDIPQDEADNMLDMLIEKYPLLAQQMLHEYNGPSPAPHLRVKS